MNRDLEASSGKYEFLLQELLHHLKELDIEREYDVSKLWFSVVSIQEKHFNEMCHMLLDCEHTRNETVNSLDDVG
jgi:hypothetical protein